MADLASIAKRRPLVDLRQHAAAPGAGNRAGRGDLLQHPAVDGATEGDLHLERDVVPALAGRVRLGFEDPDQQLGHVFDGGPEVDVGGPKRPQRHVRRCGVGWILHDRLAATALQVGQARGAVVHVAGQEHPDSACAVVQADRAEQRVDRRAAQVFPRPPPQAASPVDHQQVPVGRRDIDVARSDRLPVFGGLGREDAGAAKDLGQRVQAPGPDMDHHEDGRGELRRQFPQQGLDGVDRPGRPRDPDGSVDGHAR